MKIILSIFILLSITSQTMAEVSGDRGHAGSGGRGIETPTDVIPYDILKVPGRSYLDVIATPAGQGLKKRFEGKSFQNISFFPMDLTFPKSVSLWGEELIRTFSEELNFYLVPGPLPNTNDTGLVRLKMKINGTWVQIAIQDKNGNVAIDRRLYMKMSNKMTEVLLAHEIFIRNYYNAWSKLPVTTSEISDLVSHIFSTSSAVPRTQKSLIHQACMTDLPIHSGDYSNYQLKKHILDHRVKFKLDSHIVFLGHGVDARHLKRRYNEKDCALFEFKVLDESYVEHFRSRSDNSTGFEVPAQMNDGLNFSLYLKVNFYSKRQRRKGNFTNNRYLSGFADDGDPFFPIGTEVIPRLKSPGNKAGYPEMLKTRIFELK